MTHLVWGLAVLVGLYGLHRVALWSERRGWIHYEKKRGSSGTLSAAFLEIQALVEPSKRHVQEERQRDQEESEEDGDPPSTGINGGHRKAIRSIPRGPASHGPLGGPPTDGRAG